MKLALEVGIFCFNVESAAELERLNEVAGRCGKKAPISLRVNPNVDPKTHPYISTGLKGAKFGVAYDSALALYRRAAALPHIDVAGIDCHIGSQLLDPSPFIEALDRILALVDQMAAEGIAIHHLDLGGGLGIKYNAEQVQPTVAAYLTPLLDKLAGRGLQIVLEPGRRLVGNAGLLLTRIEYLKQGEAKNFAIIDAAMNDLMRPALYEAWHDILPVVPRAGASTAYDVVGPVCETGDFLGQDRPLAVEAGDLLAVMSAGAYGMAMASNYNTRPRAVEIMVDGEQVHVIRQRETVEQLYAGESILPK
jgi:diaminopimelate decarboxylase